MAIIGLRPRRSQRYKEVDILESVAEKAGEYGLKVNTWTVCLHNSALIKDNPELGIQDPYGGIDYNFMCPNNPEARNYMLGLVRDLATNYNIDTIVLESATYPWGIIHGDHHEAFDVYLEPFLSSLFSTCFCRYCEEKAKEYGFNLAEAREVVKGIFEDGVKMPSHILAKIPLEDSYEYYLNTTLELDGVKSLIEYKFKVAEEVLKEVKGVIKEAGSKVKLAVVTFPKTRLAEGINLSSTSKILDSISFGVYFDTPQRVYYHVKHAKERIGDRCRLHPIIKISYPEASSKSTLIEEIVAAKEAGADGLEFYNYGRTPLENLGWVREGLEII